MHRPFADTAPQHMHPEPTRAEWNAAEDAYWQEVAALRGGACFSISEDLGMLLDRYPSAWKADDKALIDQLFDLLTEARAIAERLS